MASVRVIDRMNGSTLDFPSGPVTSKYRLIRCERSNRTETYLHHIISGRTGLPKRIPVPVSCRTVQESQEWYLGF